MKRLKMLLSSYGWLILAMIFLYLSGGDRPIEIAVWLSPLLLLRFFREVKLWKSLLFTLPLMALLTILADKGMQPFPMSVAIILTVITSAIALIPYLLDRLLNRSLPLGVKTLLFPFAAVAAEAFLASEFTGGTWGNPVYGIKNMPLLQLVSVTGIWGMMFLIYWTASVFNEMWEHRHHLGDIRKMVAAFLVVLVIIYGFGLWRLHHEKHTENMLRVAGITPGPEHRAEMMEIFGKLFSPNRNEIFDTETIRTSINNKFNNLLSESSRMAESGVELVVWSEGATFIFEKDRKILIQGAIQSTQKQNYYLGLAIAILKDNCLELCATGEPFVENNLLFISPDGNIDWEYSKSNLAPGYESAMTIRGDGKLKSATTVKGTVSGAICYDMDFPDYIRQSGVMKNDLFLAPSNDWPEIKNTHAKMARLRAIENGISLLRPTSSGISIAVDPYGNIVSSVDDFQSKGAPLMAVLPMRSVSTLYTTLGDIFVYIFTSGGILLIVFGIVRRFKKRS